VIINEPREADYLWDNLNVIYDHFEPSQSSLLEKSLDRIFGDVSKGFQEMEKMLTIGTRLTGVGQLSVKKGALTLQPPTDGSVYILSGLTKSELVKTLEDKALVYKVLGGIFGIAGGIILFILLKRYYEEYRTRNEFEDMLIEIRNLPSRGGGRRDGGVAETADNLREDDESRFCVICVTQPREVILLDCGHICMCADCVELLPLPRKCPVCRDRIARILPIYVS
jgi:E3 ubiquitin-protein ligase MUL1